MTVDDQQRIIRILAGGSGQFFVVRADGEVQWWNHTGWQTGAASWANGGSARSIGSGFAEFVEILGSTTGVIWGIDAAGEVWRWRYVVTNTSTGDGYWENGGSGILIGTGYDKFRRWFGGPDGILWSVDDAGDLWRSDYVSGALTAPAKVGSGWQDAVWLAGDKGGVIYGVRLTELYWWRHTSTGWANGGAPIRIGGSAWDDRRHTLLAAVGTGLLYSIKPIADTAQNAGDLLWTRLVNYQTVATDGYSSWSNSGNATTIGGGFTVEPDAALQGYAAPMSARPGETVGICASTTLSSVSVSVWRHDVATPTQVQAPATVTGQLQTLPSGYVAGGCAWSPLTSVTVDTAWPSGVYSAQLVGPNGLTRHVPFVVRPTLPTADLMVLLPTLTYAAYNAWGGHSAYSNCPTDRPVQISLRRPSRTTAVQPRGRMDAELYSDLLLLRWLNGQGIGYDVHTDQDLHQNLALLEPYRVVVLGGHPEYVTEPMRQALALYLRAGGRIVYTGGNGLYEPVVLSADGGTALWRVPDGGRHYYRDRMLPEHQLLGVGYDSRGWMTSAPYRVLRDHPILAGTGLTVGSTFGASGFNRGASGWEFDMISAGLDGSATTADVIAQGTNGPDYGAQMVLVDRPGGGKTFSAGSIAFNGALSDPALSTLFRNVIDLMLTP